MGEAAVEGAADDAQLAAMVQLLHQSIEQGALGLSSSLDEVHTDGDGHMVPSRYAALDEFVALAGALRDHDGTTLEFIPSVGEIPAERMELMADMSLAADRTAELEPARQPVAGRDLRAAARRVRPRGGGGRPRRRALAARRDAAARQQHARRPARVQGRDGARRRHRASRRPRRSRHPPPSRRDRAEGGEPWAHRAGRLRPHRGRRGHVARDRAVRGEDGRRGRGRARHRARRRADRRRAGRAPAAHARAAVARAVVRVERRGLGEAGRDLGRRPRRARRLRRRRPPRPHVPRQLHDPPARPRGARPGPARPRDRRCRR